MVTTTVDTVAAALACHDGYTVAGTEQVDWLEPAELEDEDEYRAKARGVLAALSQRRASIALALATADAGTNADQLAAAWPRYPDYHPVKAYWFRQADAALAGLQEGVSDG